MSPVRHEGECLLRIRAGEIDAPYLLVEGARVTGWKVSQDNVDVTDAGDAPWRRLLSYAGLKSLQVRVQGLYLGSPGELLLRELAFNGAAFEGELTLELDKAVRGPFVVSELSFESAVHEEVVYAATLRSAGAVTLS